MSRRCVSGGIVVLLLLTSSLNAFGQSVDPNLKLLMPILNKKWMGVMRSPDGSASWKTYQEYRPILNGSAVKVTTSIPDIQSYNEGLLFWDRDEKKIALFIINSRGIYTKGFVSADSGKIMMEGVINFPERKFSFKNTFEFASDGTMVDRWFQNAFGDWRPGHVVEFTATPSDM